MNMKKIPQGKKLMDALLTYRRAHESQGEAQFCKRFVEPVAQQTLADETGVVHAWTTTIPRADGSTVPWAFCAHTDSVHHRGKPEPRQKVMYDPEREEYFVEEDVLGADDAAGVYVLLEMMRAGVPGKYMFFRGEERGGIGSEWVADHRPDVFEGITAAIQFDRRATHSIITHQFRGRTCSDAFAHSLAEALCMGHEPDDGGSFTDTANLADLVPECTNVSVGYYREHSKDETLDWGYLKNLADRCIDAFASGDLELVIERKPGDYDVQELGFRWGGRIGGADMDPCEDEPQFLPLTGSWSEELEEMTDEEVYDMVDWIDQVSLANLLLEVRDEMKYLRKGPAIE